MKVETIGFALDLADFYDEQVQREDHCSTPSGNPRDEVKVALIVLAIALVLLRRR